MELQFDALLEASCEKIFGVITEFERQRLRQRIQSGE